LVFSGSSSSGTRTTT